MPKKPQSTYRTSWNSIKRQCDPKALKKCDFSSGLGPALDELSKFIDPLYELDEIPQKQLDSLKSEIEKIQQTIKSYRNQIIEQNNQFPDLGESWLNLHQALLRLDENLVDEAKDLGVNVKKINDGKWLDKKSFAKRPTDGEKIDADHSKEVDTLIKKLTPKKDNPEEIMKIVGGKAIGGCFTYSPSLAEKIQRQGSAILGAIKYINTELAKKTANTKNAKTGLDSIKNSLEEIYKILGKDAEPLKKFLQKYVYDVLSSRIE